jgi:hypothetical protein
MPPDPRDDEFIEQVCSAVTGLIVATRQGDRRRLIGELNRLLHAIIEYNATRGEHPHNEALRQAVARLR